MADDGEAEDGEAENVLFRELQTTAVYDSHRRKPPERHILTLSFSEAEYQPLDEEGAAVGGALLESAPEIVVQVRKRKGAVQLLIDGFVSEGTQASENVRAHYLEFHKGLHEDWETNTCVFSPLAIVAAIEDGQHPLQSVKVAVVQRFFSEGERLGDATLLAEVNLAPHLVSDVRCGVVRAPYPLVFAKPFTLIISDATAKDAAYNTRVVTSILAIGTGAVTSAVNLSWLGALRVGSLATFSYATATGIVLAIAALARIYGQDYLAMLLKEFSTAKPDDPKADSAKMNENAMKVLGNATQKYLTARPIPQEKDTTFTLEEFAKVLESIAILKAMDGNDDIIHPEDLAKSHDFRQEKIVWHWLVTKESKGIKAFGLKIDESVTVGLHVRISIDDPMACAPATQHHEIYCGRQDKCYLGAVASGAMRDLRRIQTAIVALTAMLNSAIHAENRAQTWPDKYIFAPALCVTNLLTGRMTGNETGMGLLRKVSKYTAEKWTSLQGPNGPDNRVFWFKMAKELLQEKLIDPFFGNTGAVGDLVNQFELALGSPKAPLATPQTKWIRRLPQRVRAQIGTGLFPRPDDFSIEYAEVYTDKAIVREFTNKSRLLQAVTATMKQSKVAIQRFAKQWEAGVATQIALVCMCKYARVPLATTFKEQPRWSALTLSTPVDVQFATAIASIPERMQRRLRLVARRAQQTCDRSVLESLGLAHTNADLLACQVFGDLWVAELLAMHAAPSSQQVQMLEQASRRAAARLRSAGDLLLRLVMGGNVPVDEGVDVAPTSVDIALVATQAGRDAGRMLDRVLFSQDYTAVRAAMVPLIRNCAHTAVRAASAFANNVPVHLPHGPTASLFGDSRDGVAAFLRARSMTGDAVLMQIITAAYPSALLLDDAVTFSSEEVVALQSRVPTKRPVSVPQRQIVAAMRFRMASLQMEPTADDAENLSIDELAEELAAVKLAGELAAVKRGPPDRSFYVPFGFGDARPAPTFPPCAAPLFGTVPVFCDALVEAFRSILGSLKTAPNTNRPTKPLCVHLIPVLDCMKDPNAGPEVESAHPNTVHVTRAVVDGKECAIVTYAGSRAPATGALGYAPSGSSALTTAPIPVAEVKRAAKAQPNDQQAVALAACVSSVAWNAERVMQAVVAALASANTGEVFDAVELTLELPPNGDERSYWYSASPDPFRVQQRQHKHRMTAVRLCGYLNELSEQHLALLDNIFITIQQFGLKEQANKTGVSLAMPDDKDWLEVARVRDALLDTNAPHDPTVRQKLADPPHDARAKKALELLELIANGQVQLEEHLNKWPIVNPSADIMKAQQVLNVAQPGRTRTPTSNEASRRALVGALGVGMAMLAPLLKDLRVSCASVVLKQSDGDCTAAIERVVDAFGRCAAVRLSEACLVASQHMSVS